MKNRGIILLSKRATIRDVAKQSGVSTATVSRAVTGSPLVTEEMKKRVLQVARRIGYRPRNTLRRSIPHVPSLQPHLEVIVFSKVKVEEYAAESFTAQVLQGIQSEALHLHNAKVSVQSYNQPHPDSRTLDVLLQRDGVILIGGIDRYAELLDQILEMDIPLVVAGRQVPGKTLNCVNSEIIPGCCDLTKYLLDMGFRRFGWMSIQGAAHHFEERLAVIRGLLIAEGIQILPKDCRYAKEGYPKDILECANQWISEGDLPEVVICPSGYVVSCLPRSLASFGMSCPEDLSIACFNDFKLPDFFHPTPTCVAGFPDEIGRRAYRRLLELVQDPRERNRPEVIMIPMRFIEGDSLRPPKRS